MNSFYTFTDSEKRDYFTDLLRKGEVTVEFTKVDGSLRVMPCTLKESLLPAVTTLAENTAPRAENPAVLRVFCTDKQAWRSFRIDSVTKVTLGAE